MSRSVYVFHNGALVEKPDPRAPEVIDLVPASAAWWAEFGSYQEWVRAEIWRYYGLTTSAPESPRKHPGNARLP